MTRILLADDHEVVRAGLRRVLDGHHGWEVVGEATNGREVIDKAVETAPDIVILDYSMPVVNGIEAASRIRERLPKTEILVFTMYYNETVVEQLMRAGVRGYVLKTDAKADLARAIEALSQSKSFFTANVVQKLPTGRRRGAEHSHLTRRERDVLRLIAEGQSTKQIARLLGIGRKTVETHRNALKRKLNAGTPAGMVRYAIRHGIARTDEYQG
jgi:DNA-binding NarL/FixJ family response regulator